MRKNLIIKNAIYKFITDILRLLLPVISMPYIYRVFTPEIMGEIEFTRSVSGYFFMFCGFGVFTYGLREVARVRNDKGKRNKLFTELFIISSLSSVILSILYLIYVFLKFGDNILLRNMLLLNGIQIVSYIFYIEWINEAFEDYSFISKKTTIVKILNLICIFYFIRVGTDYYKYLFLLNIFILINNLISFIYIKRYITLDFHDLKFKKYLFPLSMIIIMANATVLYTTFDRILLGFYGKNPAQIAYYGVSQNVMLILKTMLMAVIIVSVPRLSFFLGQNKKDKYEEMLNKIIGFIFILIFPVSIGLVILSKEIVFFFGGDKYLPGQSLLIIFAFRLIVVVIQEMLISQVIFLNQREKIVAAISLSCGLLNIIVKFILIKIGRFDAWTAISTTMLAEILAMIIAYCYIKRNLKYKVEVFKIRYFKYLIMSLLFFPVGYFIKSFELFYLIKAILIFISCALLYLALLFFSKDKYLLELLRVLKITKENESEIIGYYSKDNKKPKS